MVRSLSDENLLPMFVGSIFSYIYIYIYILSLCTLNTAMDNSKFPIAVDAALPTVALLEIVDRYAYIVDRYSVK